jgi:hypothetical protein
LNSLTTTDGLTVTHLAPFFSIGISNFSVFSSFQDGDGVGMEIVCCVMGREIFMGKQFSLF